LGGLFTLGVLFDHPDSFRNFVASSPSVYWNDCALLEHEGDFVSEIRRKRSEPRVLITVGAREQEAPETPLPNMTEDQMKDSVRAWRMVDNARDLATRLQRAKGGSNYLVRFHAFEEEDHLTVFPASISRALAFSLRSPPAARLRPR
jgi:predicted alpha/beta superfamily hydrolase